MRWKFLEQRLGGSPHTTTFRLRWWFYSRSSVWWVSDEVIWVLVLLVSEAADERLYEPICFAPVRVVLCSMKTCRIGTSWHSPADNWPVSGQLSWQLSLLIAGRMWRRAWIWKKQTLQRVATFHWNTFAEDNTKEFNAINEGNHCTSNIYRRQLVG